MYFFDTYALVESWLGNPRYQPFAEHSFIASALNVGEFYEYLVRTLGKGKAEHFLNMNSFHLIEIDAASVCEAASFRIDHKKRHISRADAIGYVLAGKNRLKFLTGDSQFEDLKNVEFVQ